MTTPHPPAFGAVLVALVAAAALTWLVGTDTGLCVLVTLWAAGGQ